MNLSTYHETALVINIKYSATEFLISCQLFHLFNQIKTIPLDIMNVGLDHISLSLDFIHYIIIKIIMLYVPELSENGARYCF